MCGGVGGCTHLGLAVGSIPSWFLRGQLTNFFEWYIRVYYCKSVRALVATHICSTLHLLTEIGVFLAIASAVDGVVGPPMMKMNECGIKRPWRAENGETFARLNLGLLCFKSDCMRDLCCTFRRSQSSIPPDW